MTKPAIQIPGGDSSENGIMRMYPSNTKLFVWGASLFIDLDRTIWIGKYKVGWNLFKKALIKGLCSWWKVQDHQLYFFIYSAKTQQYIQKES